MDNNINQIKRLYLSHDYTSLSILIVVECLIIFYLLPRKYSNGYTIDLINNWRMRPIVGFEPEELTTINSTVYYLNEQLGLGNWEGIINSCNCLSSTNSKYSNQLIRKKCNKNMLKSDCVNINKIPPKSYYSWKGVILNPKLSRNTLTYLDYLKYYSNYECLVDQIDCGYLDSQYELKLCLPKDSLCPINHIFIDQNPLIENTPFYYKNIKLNDNYYLHYTNQKYNGIVLVQLKISELMPCGNPLNENRKEMEYILYANEKFRCEDSVEDYRYFELDYENKTTLYNENGIKEIIENLPLYSIKDNNQQLFYRGYIGISKKIQFNDGNLDFLDSIKRNLIINNFLRFILILCIMGVIYLSIKTNDRRINNKKILRQDIINRLFIEVGYLVLMFDSLYLYSCNSRIYYLLFYISAITSIGSKKVFHTVSLFSFLDLYICCGLVFLIFYNPFFFLSEKFAKCLPKRKDNNLKNNQSSAINVEIVANQMQDNNVNNEFNRIKEANKENEINNTFEEKYTNEINKNNNPGITDEKIDDKPPNNI